ncbi:hypothetical protein GCM10009634_61490 [Saccharothrix xinjiangensis]
MSTAIPIPPGRAPSTAPAGAPPASTSAAAASPAPSLLIRHVLTSWELPSPNEPQEYADIVRTGAITSHRTEK